MLRALVEHGAHVDTRRDDGATAYQLTVRVGNVSGAAYLALVSGAPIVPLMMFGTRPAGGGKDAMPPRGSVVDLVYGAPYRVEQAPWPRTRALVRATSDRLHARMLEDLAAGLALTGQTMPGPIPGEQPAAVKEAS